jgi:hypothetical protein
VLIWGRRPSTSPLALVVGIVVFSVLVRLAVAVLVPTPIIYPDEYLYTALSRSIAHGHFAEVRGAHVSLRETTAYLAPLLTAPMWLLSSVGVAYRLAQALGTVTFALAAFPAYGLARRLGVSGRGSVAAALVTVALPAGVFTSMLLSEPYAYPLFLVATLAAVEAIAAPRFDRVLVTLVLGVVLCVAGGLQFLYFLPACVAAYLLAGASSIRGYLARGAIILAGAAYLVHEVEVRGIVDLHYSLGTLASWFAVNLFVFALGAGWVLVPGGFVGLWGLMRGRDARGRGFAYVTALLLAAMLLEATVWSASGQGVYERFAFYAAPLVAIALIRALEGKTLARTQVAAVAYLGALGASLLPILSPLHGAYDVNAPALHALSNLNVGDRPASVIWGPVLVALALLVAWRGAKTDWTLLSAGTAICVALSIGSSIAYIRHQPDTSVPHARAPGASALVTWHGGDPYSLMKTLFWNPQISRVIVLGPGDASDGFAYSAADFGPQGQLTKPDGTMLRGPFDFAPDTKVLGASTATASGFSILQTMPPAVAFGIDAETGYLAVVGRIFATAGPPGSVLTLRLHSPDRIVRTIAVRCAGGYRKEVVVGRAAVRMTIPIARSEGSGCWFGLTRGVPATVGRFNLSVKGSISLERGSNEG